MKPVKLTQTCTFMNLQHVPIPHTSDPIMFFFFLCAALTVICRERAIMVNTEVFTSVTGTQSDNKISWTCEGNVASRAKRIIPRIVSILRKLLRFNFGIQYLQRKQLGCG